MDKVLVIDDDAALCDLLREYLRPEGFEIESAYDGRSGLERSRLNKYDLIILDIMLPEMNGFEVIRHLRKMDDTPVVMLTARGEDVDRIVGLEVGADDYLSKPFNPRELLARIRAILRRTTREQPAQPPKPKRIVVGDIEMDTGTRLVFRNSERIDLTSVEFSLLEVLLSKAGQLVAREELTNTIAPHPSSVGDRSIDVHISKLRKKLGHMTTGGERIKTIRNAGYLYTLHSVPEQVSNSA